MAAVTGQSVSGYSNDYSYSASGYNNYSYTYSYSYSGYSSYGNYGYYSNSYYNSGRSEYPYGMAGWQRTYDYADYPAFYSHCLPQDAESTQDSAVNDWIWAGVVISLFCCFFCCGSCLKAGCGCGRCCGCRGGHSVSKDADFELEAKGSDSSFDYDKKQAEENHFVI